MVSSIDGRLDLNSPASPHPHPPPLPWVVQTSRLDWWVCRTCCIFSNTSVCRTCNSPRPEVEDVPDKPDGGLNADYDAEMRLGEGAGAGGGGGELPAAVAMSG